MSDTDSFIREVTEEVERDRMNRQLRKWGPVIGIALLLLVGAAAAWQWKQDQDRAAQEAVGMLLLSADPEAAASQAGALPEGAALLSRFRLAEAHIQREELAEAIALFEDIAATPAKSAAYTDLAALRALRLRAQSDPSADVIAGLDPLALPGRPYRLLVMELRAALLLNAGQTEAAHADMNAILDDPDRTGNLQARVEQLLVASGGVRDE